MSRVEISRSVAARGGGLVLWVVAAGFGLPAPPIAAYLLMYRELPEVFGLFRAYGGGFFESLSPETFAVLLCAYFLLSAAEAYCGKLLWNGARAGAVLALALLPPEIVFWLGFALPIPLFLALIRLVLLVLARRSLH
jgi:hypothetical protein